MSVLKQFFSAVYTDMRFLLLSFFFLLLLMPVFSFAKNIYVYQKPDGSHLMTSTKMHNKGFSLLKIYRAKQSKKVLKNRRNITKKKKGSRCDLYHIKKKAEIYKQTIILSANRYNIDRALIVAIIKSESCFKVTARSHVGAIGLMQLMPDTAKYLNVRNPWNPEQNIQGGAKYIAEMLRLFKGDTRLALAAYNAGPANVKKYKGIPPFRETRNYVEHVMSDYQELKASRIFAR